jgi:lysophospholipase
MTLTEHPTEFESFVESPNNPVPLGGLVHWYTGDAGARLRSGLWLDDQQDRGTIFVLPGKGEYIEKYFEVIGELLERNFSVVSVDWRGQGLSHRDVDDPLKAYISKFETFFDDFECLYHGISSKCPGPHYILAHSMGGNISLRLAAERDLPIKALILSAPMTGLYLGKMPAQVMTAIGSAMKVVGKATNYLKGGEDYDPLTSSFEDSKVTQDRPRFERAQGILHARPQLAQGSATIGWVHEALNSTKRLFAKGFSSKLKLPILFFHTKADQLVDTVSSKKFATSLPNSTVIEFEDAEHEILMERDEIRATFWSEFDQFMSRIEN